MNDVAVIIALTCLLGFNVLLAVLVFTIASRTSTLLDVAHERTTTYTASLIDRLMAMDFTTYKSWTASQQVWPPPEEEEVEEMVAAMGPDKGGFGSRLGLSGYRPPEEEINPEEEIP